ncbi:MAG: VWA domain-containing protein [Bacteroidetes bacterium]|nr:VWA domain-containing protein [Bacteroidota bacterium]
MKSICLFVLFLLIGNILSAQETSGESPYFIVKTEGAVLPLQETSAHVNIAGTIADVTIRQVYHNKGTKQIEAIYVFPMSTQAAVHDLKMIIGNRTIQAEVHEKGAARKIYENAKTSGRRASLLEQERPNLFQMNVANIAPGDEIIVELEYTEMLVPEDGIYPFVFPTVVGPRYTGEQKRAETATAMPYLKAGEKSAFDFDIEVFIQAGMNIRNVTSSSHKVEVNYPKKGQAEISLQESENNPGNRDFILHYSLQGSKIESGLLLYEHDDEKFFSLIVQPPERVLQKDLPAREYLFVVDVSGSMNGFPLDVAKNMMRNLLGTLRPAESFNVLLFASGSSVWKPESQSASAGNIEEAIRFLGQRGGGGGTNLLQALHRAYALPKCLEEQARTMVIITDGYISVEQEAFDLISQNLDKANVFTFGIGEGVNRFLLEGMSRVAKGESFVVTEKSEAYAASEKFRKYISSPVLTQVKFNWEGLDLYEIEPPSIPDLMAQRPVVIFGKWRGELRGKLNIAGYTGSGSFEQTIRTLEGINSKQNNALRYLWAREKIRRLDDYRQLRNSGDDKKQVTDLGLKYGLATQYTSFVAVDNEVIEGYEESKTVKQPLPMPQYVPNTAVGFEAGISGVSRRSRVIPMQIAFENSSSLSENHQKEIRQFLESKLTQALRKALKEKGIRTISFQLNVDKYGTILKIYFSDSLPDEVQKQLNQILLNEECGLKNIQSPVQVKVAI